MQVQFRWAMTVSPVFASESASQRRVKALSAAAGVAVIVRTRRSGAAFIADNLAGSGSKMRHILMIALAALGLADAAAQTLPSKGPDMHLGVTSCGGSTCHGATQPVRGSQVLQNEYLIWQRQDKHAKAYAVLLEPRSQRIARNLGLPDAHTAKACLDCHSDNVAAELRGRQFQLSDGVGCEGCHGGGQRWLGPHVAGVSSTAELQKLGLFPTEDPVARAQLCLSCHLGDETKFVTHRLMGAGHPRLSFELDTFTEIQPAHYQADDDYRKRKAVASGVQTWAIGQAMAVSRTMTALADANRRMAGAFPELTFYDCHACHHPMSNLRWQARESVGLGPGMIRFNDANMLMLRLLARRLAPEEATALTAQLRALHGAMSEGRGCRGGCPRSQGGGRSPGAAFHPPCLRRRRHEGAAGRADRGRARRALR